jgi:hypothetical protein
MPPEHRLQLHDLALQLSPSFREHRRSSTYPQHPSAATGLHTANSGGGFHSLLSLTPSVHTTQSHFPAVYSLSIFGEEAADVFSFLSLIAMQALAWHDES